MSYMYEIVAVANVEPGGHYTTSLEDESGDFEDGSIFKNWVCEMAEEIGLLADKERILQQEKIISIESIRGVGMASFCFGDEFLHCIVTFVIRPSAG